MGIFYVGDHDPVRPVPWLVRSEVGQTALGMIGGRKENQNGKSSGDPEPISEDPLVPPLCLDWSIDHVDTLRVGRLWTLTSLLLSQISNLNLRCLHMALEILPHLICPLMPVALQSVLILPRVDASASKATRSWVRAAARIFNSRRTFLGPQFSPQIGRISSRNPITYSKQDN